MPDLSKIDKRFYCHPKALKARALERGSISLWLFANCFCRDHRRQGFITREEALDFGAAAEIDALVESGLWREVPGGYEFNDWLDWNPDLIRKGSRSSAPWLVYEVLGEHPEETRFRLGREVEKLMDEGVSRHAIVSGLRKWGERANSPVTWLPYFVSDAIREGQTGVRAAIKEARRTGDMSGLAEYGYRWVAPDAPPKIGVARVREFMRAHKNKWLDEIEAQIGSESATE